MVKKKACGKPRRASPAQLTAWMEDFKDRMDAGEPLSRQDKAVVSSALLASIALIAKRQSDAEQYADEVRIYVVTKPPKDDGLDAILGGSGDRFR